MKLASIGALSDRFDRDVAELYAVLEITNEGPRFIDAGAVAARLPFPVPEERELGVAFAQLRGRDHTPSA